MKNWTFRLILPLLCTIGAFAGSQVILSGFACDRQRHVESIVKEKQLQKQESCMKLANDCFEGMYRLQNDTGTLSSMAQSCLWNWQSWKCYELDKGNK